MKKAKITWALALLICISFLIDLMTIPDQITADTLIYGSGAGLLTTYGSLVHVSKLRFEFWRLITTIFLHAGIPHLLVNLTGLFLAGTALEPELKSLRFSLIFFLCGLCASLADIFVSYGSVGASGAIYGIGGCLIARRGFRRLWKASAVRLILLLLYLTLPNLSANTAWAAHAAGLCVGILCGLISRKTLPAEAVTTEAP